MASVPQPRLTFEEPDLVIVRGPIETWVISDIRGVESVFRLESGIEVPFAEIYEDLEFPKTIGL